MKLGSIVWDPVYGPILVKQDKISAVLSSVSNTLDPLSFANGLANDAAVIKLNMSTDTTSALSPDISDDLWCDDESMSLIIDLNNIE